MTEDAGTVLVFFFSSRRRHTRSKRDWSSDVCSSNLIGAAGERFLDKNVARNGAHYGEHRLVAYALLAQTRDHAVARALRGHADAAGFREHYFAASHALITGICC